MCLALRAVLFRKEGCVNRKYARTVDLLSLTSRVVQLNGCILSVRNLNFVFSLTTNDFAWALAIGLNCSDIF